jgi:hypothetical protein
MKTWSWLVLAAAAVVLSVSCVHKGAGVTSGLAAGDYVVLAWNDLGMHCINPTYDQAVLLPPFNTLWAQVVKRGNPPQVVTSGLTVTYSVDGNTYSYGKRDYGQFWDHAGQLFGATGLAHDVGLKGSRLTGAMAAEGDHFVAVGIPLVPVDDAGTWNPFQVATIVVKDAAGRTLVETKAMVPVSDEINCSKCHGEQPFQNILSTHDKNEKTSLAKSAPVLCAACHGDPALGTSGPGSSGKYLSEAMHGWHATRGPVCYDCHPGPITQCQRSLRHAGPEGNCTACHGGLAEVAGSIAASRIPWAGEPACAKCHGAAPGVDTGAALYRNSTGHGGVYCAACHSSPHAMIPSREAPDNYQALEYQGMTGVVKTIASCGICHKSSRGAENEIAEFAKTHGGKNPRRQNACHVCHTVVPTDRAKWPHAYGWKNSK